MKLEDRSSRTWVEISVPASTLNKSCDLGVLLVDGYQLLVAALAEDWLSVGATTRGQDER